MPPPSACSKPADGNLPGRRPFPTAGNSSTSYLAPLAALPAISSKLQTGARVIAVTRAGMDKTHTRNRESTPFVVRVEHEDGETRDHTVAGVIDASGTWSTRNPLGTSGLPSIGEDRRRRPDLLAAPGRHGP